MAPVKTFSITNKTKSKIPVLPFLLMKNAVLGKTYNLSLLVAGDKETQAMNRFYRKKTYTPNVLSFSVAKGLGEIVLNLRQAKRECGVRKESFRYFVALLFIHSMFHLKGYRHGSTMERQVEKLLAKFHIKNTYPK